ncbi:beta strand repeat-containing protein [Nocardioides kribbensis]|uniref:Big-1 domain-containing protein n=1 Tax=Nocardioides kribbensis TaxID=305517 RepID=A0ABV1P3H6_9ACTN
MNSSGIKRGLATTAIAALAVTGVPAIANAAPLTLGTGSENVVTLVDPTLPISAQADGTNSTYRLTAQAGTGVTSVTFSYSLNGVNFTEIGSTTRNDNGVFGIEWDASAVAGAPAVTIRATGNVAGTTTDEDTAAAPVAANNTVETVNITNGDTVGVFQAPYGGGQQNVIVNGTSSDPAATPDLEFLNGAAFAAGGTAVSTTTGTNPTTGTWAGILNIAGYQYGSTNELLVRASEASEDTEAFALYQQTITTVNAVAGQPTAGGAQVPVTVTVLDQNQRPIAGARVASSTGGATQLTNAQGQATFTQTDASAYYYADATAATGYQANLGDKRSNDVALGQYVPVASSLDADSSNGAAFDFDEYDANDITVQVQDQQGIDFGGVQQVQYYFTFTAFDGTTTQGRFPATGTSTVPTDANGEADIPLPTVTEGGTFTLFAGVAADPNTGNGAVPVSNVLTFKAGDATLDITNADPASAPAGGEIVVSGTLLLEDGTALAGRPIDLSYTSVGGNAGFNQTTGADQPTLTVTTGANGGFSATLDDVATAAGVAQPTENGTVTADTADYDDSEGDIDNALEGDTLAVIFSQATAPAASTVDITGLDANTTPGVADLAEVEVVDANGAPVANQNVTLTIGGDAFFTDGTYTGAAGSEGGNLRDLGQTITVATDNAGVAEFLVGIGRSEDFDDDGDATATVTATVATAGTTPSASDTATADFDSSNPLNIGEVSIEPTDDDGFLPEARVGDFAEFDVFVTDQFGNLTDVTVALSDNTGFADLSSSSVTSDFLSDGDFFATAEQEVDQVITASVTRGTVNVDGNGNAVAGPNETVSDTYTVEWYEYSLADGTVTITSSPEGVVMVGMPVTETVRVLDSAGNPVQGLDVRFIRQGPGTGADGDANFVTTTNANGEAFYTFVGTEEGTANITVSVTDGDDVLTAQDTVVFDDGVEPPVEDAIVIANLSANNNGAKPDRLKVTTGEPRAAGAVVKFFRIKASGGNVQVGQGVLDDMGQLKKNVKDVNGKKFSRYFARVLPTDDSTGDRSNNTRVR